MTTLEELLLASLVDVNKDRQRLEDIALDYQAQIEDLTDDKAALVEYVDELRDQVYFRSDSLTEEALAECTDLHDAVQRLANDRNYHQAQHNKLRNALRNLTLDFQTAV